MNSLIKRLAFFGCIMVLTALACTAPFIGEETPEVDDPFQGSNPSGLTNVEISPHSGKGTFNVTVTYFWRLGDSDFKIVCTYPDMDGKPHSETMELDHDESGSTTINIYVDIPGTYNVACTDTSSHNAATVFTVTGEPEPTGGETKPVKYKTAKITLDGTKIKFDAPRPKDTSAGWLQGWCFPSDEILIANGESYFNVAEDGTLDGKCSFETGKDTVLGKISGKYDSSNDRVIFRLVSSHKTFDNDANYWVKRIVFDGSGPLDADTASGTADFTVTCDGFGWFSCGNDLKSLKYSGSVPFMIKFLP